MADRGQFATFLVDGLFFGIEVAKVQEVVRHQETTRVPLAHRVVSGLVNLRGQIVTAIDLRRRLHLRERPADQLPMNVVLRTDDGVVSLLVDEIGDVLEIGDDRFERPPETIDERARDLVRGVYKLDDHLLSVLDAERTVELDEHEASRGEQAADGRGRESSS